MLRHPHLKVSCELEFVNKYAKEKSKSLLIISRKKFHHPAKETTVLVPATCPATAKALNLKLKPSPVVTAHNHIRETVKIISCLYRKYHWVHHLKYELEESEMWIHHRHRLLTPVCHRTTSDPGTPLSCLSLLAWD